MAKARPSLRFYVVLARELGSARLRLVRVRAGADRDAADRRRASGPTSWSRGRSPASARGAGHFLANVAGLKARHVGRPAGDRDGASCSSAATAPRSARRWRSSGSAWRSRCWPRAGTRSSRATSGSALVSACLILQRTLTAVVGITILLAGGGLLGAALAYLGGALVGLAAAEYCYRRWTPVAAPRPDPGRRDRDAARRASRSGVAGLLFVLLLKVDVLLLSFLDSNAEVGLYSAAYRLIEGAQFVPWAFNAAMLPWLARATRSRRWSAGTCSG